MTGRNRTAWLVAGSVLALAACNEGATVLFDGPGPAPRNNQRIKGTWTAGNEKLVVDSELVLCVNGECPVGGGAIEHIAFSGISTVGAAHPRLVDGDYVPANSTNVTWIRRGNKAEPGETDDTCTERQELKLTSQTPDPQVGDLMAGNVLKCDGSFKATVTWVRVSIP